MDDWRECRLGDIGTVVGGGTPSRERADYWDGSIPWLTPGEITGNRKKFVSETQDGISTLGLAASGAKLLSTGSLLMTSRASIGSCALAGKPMATNQGFTNLTPGTDVDPSFLFHLGLTLGREMTRRASGTTFLEISGREFGRIAVRLPPLEEQRWIAEVLDTIDETIQATEHVIAKRKRIRAGLAIDLVEGRLGDARLTAWNSIETPDCGYPSQLPPAMRLGKRETCRLADVADSIVDGPFGSALKTEHYVQDPGVRVVRLANLGEGHYIDDDEAFIDEDYANVLSRHEVRSGDVLVASLGDDSHRPGRACLYPVEFAPGIVKADCFRVRPSNSVDSRFLMEILNSKSAAARVRELAQGVTRNRVNLRHLRRIVLQVPQLGKQRRIAEILDSIDETVQANEGRLDKLRHLRSGLAADLLSGRVRTVAA